MGRKNVHLTSKILLAITLFACLFIISGASTSSSADIQSPAEVLGGEIVVGSFNVHVQLKRERVNVTIIEPDEEDVDGGLAAALPVTQLDAQFINWDRDSRTVSISVAIENIGSKTLFSSIDARVVRISPSSFEPANADGGTGPGSWHWEYNNVLGGDGLLSPGKISEYRQWDIIDPATRDFQIAVQIVAGVPLAPGEGGTIKGAGGTSITVQPNSIPYEVLIDIAPASPSDIVAPSGEMEIAGAVDVTYQPSEFGASLPQVSTPFEISIPAPPDTPVGSEFIIGQQELVDFIGPPPGLIEQFIAVDTASLVDGNLVTAADIFPGIFGGGLFAFLSASGSGFATGIVDDPTGIRPGAVVSNNTNTLVSIADGTGKYTLFISGGPFTVTGFDPFRGSSGTTAGIIITHGSMVTADIALSPLATPPITRDGIRNSAFERGDLTSWATTGAASVRQQLVCTGATIQPTEGQWMADINTGPGSVGSVGSSLKQRFIVPAGVQTLRLDFNYISEEFPEWVGSIFNDSFLAAITTPQGETTFAQVTVNQSGGYQLIGDCSFPGGDSTAGMTGWRTASVDVSAFAGTGTSIQVDLIFSANDRGDNIFDTHVLVDNIRFATVWADIKVITGATASLARIQGQVQAANEILSQAGINVRIRNVQTIADPGGLLDTDIDLSVFPTPTAEETQLLGLSRSGIATDLNIYYVRSFQNGSACAIAVGPDDFTGISILTNSGAIITDINAGCTAAWTTRTFAHELGHLLISPDTAGSTLEHLATAGNFMSTQTSVASIRNQNLLSRQQSANINRAGAPILVP